MGTGWTFYRREPRSDLTLAILPVEDDMNASPLNIIGHSEIFIARNSKVAHPTGDEDIVYGKYQK